MKAFVAVILLAGLGVLGADSLFAAERAKADVNCAATDVSLVYECKIKLTGRKSGAPINGAQILIKADMPAMAMAHNIRPVKAKASGMPGMYTMRIRLEMMGEWALRLNISGPLRDQVIVKREFGQRGSNMAAGGMKDGSHGTGSMKGQGHAMQKSGSMKGQGHAMKKSGSMKRQGQAMQKSGSMKGQGHAMKKSGSMGHKTQGSGSMNPCSSK